MLHFTSDLHLGHRKAAEHRGYDDVSEHDRAIVENWNAVVRPDDEVWVLGDLAMSSPTYALALIGTLPGRKRLILGNHDKPHPMHRDAHKHLRAYLEVFDSVAQSARRRVEGTEVLLSHFPYHRDRGPVRHTQWRLRDEGRWLLHGHTHGSEQVTIHHYSDHLVPTREIHVGVDAWDLTPVPLTTIARLIQEHTP